MLEREDDDIAHSFERGVPKRSSKALRNRHPDAAIYFGRVPARVVKDFLVKRRETQDVLIPVSVHVCTDCQKLKLTGYRNSESPEDIRTHENSSLNTG
jgi:NMD protein affecting ribosome stability and mRNA decay